jgi:hypothetical protein
LFRKNTSRRREAIPIWGCVDDLRDPVRKDIAYADSPQGRFPRRKIANRGAYTENRQIVEDGIGSE